MLWPAHAVAQALYRRAQAQMQQREYVEARVWTVPLELSPQDIQTLLQSFAALCADLLPSKDIERLFFCVEVLGIRFESMKMLEACKDLRRLLDIDPNIQDREWMIVQGLITSESRYTIL